MEKGFTLIELLIVLALSSIVLASVFRSFLTMQKVYDTQDQVAEMNQNARVAMERIAKDIRNIVNVNAGTLVPSEIQILSNQDIDSNPSSGIDLLRIVVYTSDSPKRVNGSTTSSNTVIPVDSTSGFKQYSYDDYAVITDRTSTEVFRITQKSSSPYQFTTSQALLKTYAANSEVYQVNYLDYGIKLSDSSCNCPVLKRKNNESGYAWTLAENIEDLNFTLTGNAVQITLVARTRKQDASYGGDGYRRRTLTSYAKIRNM